VCRMSRWFGERVISDDELVMFWRVRTLIGCYWSRRCVACVSLWAMVFRSQRWRFWPSVVLRWCCPYVVGCEGGPGGPGVRRLFDCRAGANGPGGAGGWFFSWGVWAAWGGGGRGGVWRFRLGEWSGIGCPLADVVHMMACVLFTEGWIFVGVVGGEVAAAGLHP